MIHRRRTPPPPPASKKLPPVLPLPKRSSTHPSSSSLHAPRFLVNTTRSRDDTRHAASPLRLPTLSKRKNVVAVCQFIPTPPRPTYPARGQPDITRPHRMLNNHRTPIPANWNPRTTRATPAAPDEHSQNKFSHVDRHGAAHVAHLCAGLRVCSTHPYTVHALFHTRFTHTRGTATWATLHRTCKLTYAAAHARVCLRPHTSKHTAQDQYLKAHDSIPHTRH
jgi:hypothetical protein